MNPHDALKVAAFNAIFKSFDHTVPTEVRLAIAIVETADRPYNGQLEQNQVVLMELSKPILKLRWKAHKGGVSGKRKREIAVQALEMMSEIREPWQSAAEGLPPRHHRKLNAWWSEMYEHFTELQFYTGKKR